MIQQCPTLKSYVPSLHVILFPWFKFVIPQTPNPLISYVGLLSPVKSESSFYFGYTTWINISVYYKITHELGTTWASYLLILKETVAAMEILM
jgi:hypothetical protein